MREMQAIATDVPVCQSVCHAVYLGFVVQKTAEGIDVLFGVNALGDLRNSDRRAGPISPRRGEGEAHSMQPSRSYFGLLLAACLRLVT